MPCIYLFQDSHDNDSDTDNEIEDHSQNVFQEFYQKLKETSTVDVADVTDYKKMQKEINPVYFAFEKLKGTYQLEPELENNYKRMNDILISKGYLAQYYLPSPQFFDSAPEVDVGFSTTFL